jgi:hypothetical protein
MPLERRILIAALFCASLATFAHAQNAAITTDPAPDKANPAAKLATRPMLVITSDDGLAPQNDALVEALHRTGNKRVNSTHMATDHSYSDHRIALQQTVLEALASLQR